MEALREELARWGLADRAAEVKQRCRTALQASVEALFASPVADTADPVAA